MAGSDKLGPRKASPSKPQPDHLSRPGPAVPDRPSQLYTVLGGLGMVTVFLAGLGCAIGGIGVLIYQCVGWLKSAVWQPISIGDGFAWLGAQAPRHRSQNMKGVEWRPLAAQGNAMAQNNLGVMYAKRLGRRVFCLTSGLPPTRAGRMQKPLLAGGATEPMMSQRWL